MLLQIFVVPFMLLAAEHANGAFSDGEGCSAPTHNSKVNFKFTAAAENSNSIF